MDMKQVFGGNLKRYRTMRNLSQEKFAELCGLHRTYISDLERCRRNVSIDNIQKIAAALDVRPYVLLLDKEDEICLSTAKSTKNGSPG